MIVLWSHLKNISVVLWEGLLKIVNKSFFTNFYRVKSCNKDFDGDLWWDPAVA